MEVWRGRSLEEPGATPLAEARVQSGEPASGRRTICEGGEDTGTQDTRHQATRPPGHQGTVITRVSIRMAVDSLIFAALSGPDMSLPIN